MNGYEMATSLLRSPPGWIVAAVVTIVVAHILRIAIDFSGKADATPTTLVGILELFVVAVLGAIAVHQYIGFELSAEGGESSWVNHPMVLLAAFVAFAMLSIAVLFAAGAGRKP